MVGEPNMVQQQQQLVFVFGEILTSVSRVFIKQSEEKIIF